MSNLKVSFIQTNLYWQDIGANLAMLEEKLWEIEEETDLIVLPEMFNTGFTMDAQRFAEPEHFTTYKWMHQIAKQKNAIVTGSYIVKSGGEYFNRLYWVSPHGKSESYDKRHLFRMGEENLHYSAGTKRQINSYKSWNILPLICYDLRFPVWSRNRKNAESNLPEYDLLIYIANWPAPRTEVWDTLLKARALENQCYCLGVNRIGIDGMKVEYNGHSACYDFKGNLMNKIHSESDQFFVELDLVALQAFRKKFPAYLDGDNFTIT